MFTWILDLRHTPWTVLMCQQSKTQQRSRSPQSGYTGRATDHTHLLGHESPTSDPGVAPLREQQLRTVQHIHQHGEFSLHHWAELLLQGGHYILRKEAQENLHGDLSETSSFEDITSWGILTRNEMWAFHRYTPPSHGTQYLFFQYRLLFCVSATWVSVVICKAWERRVAYIISKDIRTRWKANTTTGIGLEVSRVVMDTWQVFIKLE